MRIRPAAFVLLAVVTACDDNDPIALDPAPAAVQILGIADSLLFGDTMNATVDVRNADGVQLTQYQTTWSSSNPAVLNVDADGAINAWRPGSAFLRAQVGAVVDSVPIRIVTTPCGLIQHMDDTGSNFAHGALLPGAITQSESVIDMVTYMDSTAVYGSGVLYGTTADNVVHGYMLNDLRGDVCRVDDGVPFHVVTQHRLRTFGSNVPPAVPGLRVIQDVYAFNGQTTDDFIVLRYEFMNEGSAVISDLAVGQGADFDLYGSFETVSRFDPATGVTDQIHMDSIARPRVVGMVAVDETVVSYHTGMFTFNRAQAFTALTAGGTTARQGTGDLWQTLGIEPFDLQPGETRNVYFVIDGAENRAAFNAHLAQAIATVRLMRP